MFGRLLGKALALPVRILNAPVRVAAEVCDVADEVPDPLGHVANAIEKGVAEAIDDEDD